MRDRLFRSRENRVIAGVAGGLAEYFAVDVVIVRIIFVVAAFAGGSGVLAYILAWLVVPEKDALPAGDESFFRENKEYFGKHNEKEVCSKKQRQRSTGLGYLLIVLGILLLGRHLWVPLFYNLWPLLLIVAGVYLLARARGGY